MTRVLLVDDESLTRETLRDYLRLDPSLHVVGEAADGQVALRQTVTLRPDLILMDMQMPVLDGVGATAKIHAECPEVKILGLTTFATDRYVVDLLRAGASGYIVKDTKPRDLIAAIHTVLAGESALSPEVTKYVIKGLEESIPAVVPPNQDLLDKLTEKEMEVIRLLAQGMSNREMAKELFVTESTIKQRFVKVMEKMGVRDRIQILVEAIQHGLVTVGRG
ncbi:response regulator transcription factor [uncultured Actinomyces sp.]|jgi:two-component system response regulator|uniref:response regulator transcription factor n=1 Tax=uncultured Actinomyces sp. TaxID=249061 RepID=UPI0028D43FF1|nr:response regulator transcription factor [uncultured Actinomyces sp.]